MPFTSLLLFTFLFIQVCVGIGAFALFYRIM